MSTDGNGGSVEDVCETGGVYNDGQACDRGCYEYDSDCL